MTKTPRIAGMLCAALAGFGVAQAMAQATGIASQYRAAAGQYRSAAAACPSSRGCYYAHAAYHDCLADQLGKSGPANCTAPTCQPGPCQGAATPSLSATPGGAEAPANGLQTFNALSAAIINMLEAQEQAAKARERRQVHEALEIEQAQRQRVSEIAPHMARINAELQESVSTEERRAAEDETARVEAKQAARRQRITDELAKPVQQMVWPGQKLVAGLEPAFDNAQWSPWMAMKTDDGTFIDDLDIAYCCYGPQLPSGSERDFPTQWKIRNRAASTLNVWYELEIQCLNSCANGWYRFQATVPAGQVSPDSRRMNTWQIWDNRVSKLSVGR